MSQPVLVAVYQPGTSLLHRLPAGAKLVGLTGLSVAIVAVRGMWWSLAFLAVALVLAAAGRVSVRLVVRAGRGVLVVALVIAGFQWWLSGYPRAVETLVDLLALALMAIVLGATTPMNAMLDTLVRAVGPLRRFGADPDRVALTVSLALQALPGTIALAAETRDAARARGLRTPRAQLSPFVIRVVARAHETGDALMARGLGD